MRIFLRQFLISLLAFCILLPPNTALAASGSTTVMYDLVAIVVDKDLYESDEELDGLDSKYGGFFSDIDKEEMRERVDRYADDLVENYPLTDTEVIAFDSSRHTVLDIAGALENLYRNGSRSKNRLKGVVFVGDVPLPVVNKNGNSFVSMFPYTDFSDKAFKYRDGSFELDGSVNAPKAEVWHGVIRSNDMNDLANFFDKNHLYYEGHEDFADFDQTMFFADLVNEEARMNEDLFPFYEKRIEEMEDIAYDRFNKFWLKELMAEMLKEAGIEKSKDELNFPDVSVKDPIMDILKPYAGLFSSFYPRVNDWVASTGRYANADTVPQLISEKDEAVRKSLRRVNDDLEARINDVVMQVEEKLLIPKSATLKGKFVELTEDPITEALQVESAGMAVKKKGNANYVFHFEKGEKFYVNGVSEENLENAGMCSFYLGSEGEGTLTRAMRMNNPGTAFFKRTFGIDHELSAKGAKVLGFMENGKKGNSFDGKLQKGDLITKIDGKKVNASFTLTDAANEAYERDSNEIEFEFVRAGDNLKDSAEYNVDKKHERTSGALITLYNTRYGGFENRGYDQSAGCNANSAGKAEEERCFYTAATIPVRDGGGAVRLRKLEDGSRAFLSDGYKDGPQPRNLDELDREIVNACFYGMQDDLYEESMESVEDFIVNTKDIVDGEDGPERVNPPANMAYLNREEKRNAANVIISDVDEDEVVTLKMFSDRYGLFDGLDNDGNGIADYEWRDEDKDGLYETKWYDFGEENADPLPADDMNEIARRMLSHNSIYTIPQGLSPYGKDLVLKVVVEDLKEISSMVVHNEPTNETIARQVAALGSADMPVDDPRYVYFQVKGEGALPSYPFDKMALPVKYSNFGIVVNPLKLDKFAEKNKITIDSDLTEQLKTLRTDKHYFAGNDFRTVMYPNAFDSADYGSFLDELEALALHIAKMPGAERIFAQKGEYSVEQIQKEIFDNYLKPIAEISQTELRDAFDWKEQDIDFKHSYVLGNMSSYEAGYFVFDGDSNSFDLRFDKGSIAGGEADEAVATLAEAEENLAAIAELDAEKLLAEAAESDSEEFVSLLEFIDEVQEFIGYFANLDKVNIHSKCSEGVHNHEEEELVAENSGELVLSSFRDEIYGDAFIADNESLITFKLGGASDAASFSFVGDELGLEIVKSGDDFALVKAGKKAGQVKVRAEVGEAFAEKVLQVEPGELAEIHASRDTSVLLANGQSRARTEFELRDKFGNIANNSFETLSITVNGPASLSSEETTATFAGYAYADIIASEDSGEAVMTVTAQNGVSSEVKFDVLEEMDLELKWKDDEVKVASGEIGELSVVLSSDGKILRGYNAGIEISGDSLVQPKDELVEKMQRGKAKAKFVAGEKAGKSEVRVDLPGFISDSVVLNVLPDTAVKLRINAEEKAFTEEELNVTVDLLDQYENVVFTDTGRKIGLKKTEGSKDLAAFLSAKTALSLDGVASFRLKAGDESGVLGLAASSPGLEGTMATVKLGRGVSSKQVRDFDSPVKYASMSGGAFGDVSSPDNLASSMLYSGKVQAVSAMTAVSDGGKKLVNVGADGEIEILDSDLDVEVVLASESLPYQKVRVGELMEMYFVPTEETEINIEALSEEVEVDDGVVKLRDEEIFRVDEFGRVSMVADLQVELGDGEGFNLKFIDKGLELATVSFVDDFGKNVEVVDGNRSAFFPGVYVKLLNEDSRYSFEDVFSGISSEEPMGATLVDNEDKLASNMQPTFSYENHDFGFGFKERNKHMLLYAAGNSVGESNQLYASAAGIVMGDPMIRVEVEGSKFSDDIGTNIYSGQEDVMEMKEFDYNEDGEMDIAVIYESGKVRLLENQIRNGEFVDRGEILNVYGGILSSAVVESDLVLGTKESCVESEQCISLFKNVDGKFVREPMNLALGNKAYKMEGKDLNGDSCDDLVASDSAGNVRVFMNKVEDDECSGVERNYLASENFGIQLDGKLNMIADLKVKEGSGFVDVVGNGRFGTSTKKVETGSENIDVGDSVYYTITLVNSGSSVSEIVLSDFVPDALSVDLESLECLDTGCSDNLRFEPNDTLDRPYMIEGISVPGFSRRTIRYRAEVDKTPKVDFSIMEDGRIFVKPEYNPTLTKYYLSAYPEFKRTVETPELTDSSAAVNGLLDELGLGEDSNMVNAKKFLNKDSDYDNIPDRWGAMNIAEEIANMSCSGGACLPNPYNFALLAPDGQTPGIALFAAGVPNPSGVGFAYPSNLPSNFRLYLNPTTAGGLTLSACAGPSAGLKSPCFVQPLPLELLGGQCPDITGKIEEGLASAQNYVSGPAGNAVISDGKAQGLGSEAFSSQGSASSTKTPFSVASNVNIRIPGFPSVFTNWIDQQTDEIYSKLLDLPDFYFIYPDFKTIITDDAFQAAEGSEIASVNDFLNAVNAIPLIEIESKEVMLKIPAISKAEIDKYKFQTDAWIRYHVTGLKELEAYWQADFSAHRRILFDALTADISGLLSAVMSFSAKLDMLGNLPRDILNYKTAEAKYATQLICYMDAVIETTGGYMKRQNRIMEAWMKAAEDAIRTFNDWKVVLNLSVDYQESCDRCKNDQYSNLGMLFNLFFSMPDIPVIPFPKWPDVVFDMSQVRTGIKVKWPDLVFRPEPIQLPDLPTVNFNDLLELPTVIFPNLSPGASLNADGSSSLGGLHIDAELLESLGIEIPSLELPGWLENFPAFEGAVPNLPDLPPLPFIELPDLPRPPQLPKLPNFVGDLAANLKPAFKILCLLKNGYLPVEEASLATEIETLTQPTVNATLPFMKSMGMNPPGISYDYVEQIRIDAKMSFDINTDAVYILTKIGADFFNDSVGAIVDSVNGVLSFPLQELVNQTVQVLIDEAREQVHGAIESAASTAQESIDSAAEEVNTAGDKAVDKATGEIEKAVPDMPEVPEIPEEISALQEYADNIQVAVQEYADSLEDEFVPEKYELKVGQHFVDKDADILNRSLDEVEAKIALEDWSSMPAMKPMLAMRDNLIAHTKNVNEANVDFGTMLASDHWDTRKLAATEMPSFDFDNTVNYITGDSFRSQVEDRSEELQEIKNELLSGAKAKPQNVLPAVPAGMYLDGVDILAYKAELSGMKMLFIDSENDGDEDIVYTMGRDIFLKKNHKEKKSYGNGDNLNGFFDRDIDEYAGDFSVNNVRTEGLAHKKAVLNWDSVPGAMKYEVFVKESLDGDLDDALIFETDESKLEMELENGNQYAYVFAVDDDGESSLLGDHTLLSPQECSDTTAPFPVIGGTDFEVALYQNVQLDASKSFDADGEITEYYLKDLSNGKEISSSLPGKGMRSNPKFTFGPFKNKSDIGMRNYNLFVSDQSGNTAEMEIRVNIVAPGITLGEELRDSGVAQGGTVPKVSNLPFELVRERYVPRISEGKTVMVPQFDILRKEDTDFSGRYYINDFDLSDLILVKNSDGEVAAEINPETGNIGAVKSGANVLVNGNSLQIFEDGRLLGTVVLNADSNNDVHIDFDELEIKPGVHVFASSSEFEFAEGVVLRRTGDKKGFVLIKNNGDYEILDKRMTVRKKDNNHEIDPLVFEFVFKGKVVAEMYIGASDTGRMNFVDVSELPVSVGNIASIDRIMSGADDKAKKFKDLSEELSDGVEELVDRGVIEALEDGDSKVVNAQEFVTRAEFVEVLLRLLCIEPRPEAYLEPHAFSDIGKMPYVKEAALRGLIHGYKGESGEPFKPYNSISRAEAVKIILEALEMKDVLDISALTIGEPWYEPFVAAAQDLTEFQKDIFLKNNFIVTAQEALAPNEAMTNEELIQMSTRVLDFYNCFEHDGNKDGLSDFCSEKYDLKTADGDKDNDGLNNALECSLNTDPTNADSDGDGSDDGQEYGFGTDPNDANDNAKDTDGDGLTDLTEINLYNTDPENPDTDGGGVNDGDEVLRDNTDPNDGDDDGNSKDGKTDAGIYLSPAECNICPCPSTFVPKAEVASGDKFYTRIFDIKKIPVSRSNEVIID